MKTAGAQGRLHLAANGAYIRFQDPPAVPLGSPGSLTPLATNGYLLQLGAVQPLYTGGRRSLALRASRDLLDAAEAARDAADVELTASVAHAFDDALLARALRGVAESAVEALRDAVRVAREHYDAGTVAALDVARAETKLAAAEAALREARAAEATAREALAVTVGLDADAPNEPSGSLVSDSPVLDSAATLAVAAAAPARPDIAALRAQAAAFESRADIARASLRPSAGA